ncbi:MAG TPA: MarR family winged helix-turn-helix transcriptional regulator, partial [Myxococcota bacterium]
ATDPDDGRTRVIVLTPKGREAKPVLVPIVKRLVADIERGIPIGDLETTRRTLERIVRGLGG